MTSRPHRVFISHSGANHALAIALRSILRAAGFEPYVYDPRQFRPPAQVELKDAKSIWFPLDLAHSPPVNISHLCSQIESASYVIVLDDAAGPHEIESWHVKAEVFYARWLARVGPRGPLVVGMPRSHARGYVFEDNYDLLRSDLLAAGRLARPRVTFARGRVILASSVLLLIVCAATMPSKPPSVFEWAWIVGGTALLLLTGPFTRSYTLLMRSAHLGEVNALSPLAQLLVGHAVREFGGHLSPEDAVKAQVVQDLFALHRPAERSLLQRTTVMLPWILLLGLIPLHVLVSLVSAARRFL